MGSLRSRLILGFALVAVIPLAVAMFLLTERIEAMVRSQAVQRLDAALGAMQQEVARDSREMAEKLAILARDPQLKRLYLLKPTGSRDLSEYLVERQFLLGLDFLAVLDSAGAVIGEGSAAGAAPRRASPGARVEPDAEPGPHGPIIERLIGGTGLAMAASAPIRYQSEVVGLVHGGLTLDAALLSRLGRANALELTLRDAHGRVVATTLERAPEIAPSPNGAVERIRAGGQSYLSESVPLMIGAAPGAAITGMVPTEAADRTISTIQVSSALLGALGLGIAVSLGLLWSSQVSRPVERLARYADKLARGEWDEPLTLRSVRELDALVAALERMRGDLTTYRGRLVVSERQAAWSEMARKVAHEIKNPLTPIAVSVADLKRSYEQQRADFPAILDHAVRTIADEVETLKRLLSEFAAFGRFPAPQPAPCRVSEILADLEALYAREVAAGRLAFRRPEEDVALSVDAGQIRQALVNLIQNGLEAVAAEGRVTVSAASLDGGLQLTVADTGPGLMPEQRARLFTPGFTTKAHGSGLGLTIVERIANDHGGTVTVESAPGSGTAFRIRLPASRET
ncbi:MAG TPA: ATP-binding protein [Candidatus Eisenbacteria bacterium]|jgi:nitrogen fixation/metabolism regulation signal transduction histidine kinase